MGSAVVWSEDAIVAWCDKNLGEDDLFAGVCWVGRGRGSCCSDWGVYDPESFMVELEEYTLTPA